jgi:hypothetical protein
MGPRSGADQVKRRIGALMVVGALATGMAACGGSSAATGSLSDWCNLTIGQAKASVLKVMGPSNGTQAASYEKEFGGSGTSYAEWDGVSGDILVATFENGSAQGLQAYAGTIGPDPATNLSCKAFR